MSTQTIKNYKIIRELKGGAQGFVYLVEDMKTHEQLCLKSMSIPESKRGDYDKTMSILKLVSESDVKDVFVKYKEHFFQEKNAVLVMEYCSGGDLQTLIEKRTLERGRFSEAEINKLLIDGTTALEKLHALGMIHRDVKGANFLIGDHGKFKICDLNTSKLLEGTKGASTVVGTLENSAPEVISSEDYSYPVDMWSLGTVLYQMMVGRTPFVNERGLNVVKLAQGIYNPVDAALGYSQPLVDFVGSCLLVDPLRRPTPAQALALPFVAAAREAALRAAAEARTSALENSVERVLQGMDELRRTGEELRREMEGLRKANAEQHRTIAELQREVVVQQRANEKLRGEVEGLRKANADQQGTNAELRREMVVLQRTNEELQRNSTTLATQIAEMPKSKEKVVFVGDCPVAFLPYNPPGGVCYSGNIVYSAMQVNKAYTFGLNCELLSGRIYVLDLMTKDNTGLVLRTQLSNSDRPSGPGSCILTPYNGLRVGNSSFAVTSGYCALNFQSSAVPLTLELDASGLLHVLRFFGKDRQQMAHTVLDVPDGVVFFVGSEWINFSIEVRSLRTVAQSLASGKVTCAEHRWEK